MMRKGEAAFAASIKGYRACSEDHSEASARFDTSPNVLNGAC
jgi:hypothetical protein